MDRNSYREIVEEGKALAWLSYLNVLVIIPILLQRDNPYTRFHIRQGLALLIVTIIWGFVSLLPVIGKVLSLLGSVYILIMTVMGVLDALSGRERELPLLSNIAKLIEF